ncbi:hypothetical protein N9I31_03970 [Candidatus Pseudothioglobus singularis]|nr:hypothetical protein [Candidatus Pseudothioglobus singularis]
MNKKRVMAIIVASPLTQNIFERIGADIMNATFDVVVIDCMDWIRKYKKRPLFKPIQEKNIFLAESKSEFNDILSRVKVDYVLDFIGRGNHTRLIQDICKDLNIIYITHLLASSPQPITQKSLVQALISEPIVTIKRIFNYILRLLYGEKPLSPDVALLAGSEGVNSWTKSAKKVIFTATPNYFTLQNIINRENLESETVSNLIPKGEYILFLDDCLSMSFDYDLSSYKPVYDSSEYFSLLEKFFLILEEYFHIPVVIAAHPNGKEFNGYEGLFGKRIVKFDESAKLSSNCKFAITHFSSAITYPILLRKPILLLNSTRLLKTPQGRMINYIAEILSCNQINMDDDVSTKDITGLKLSKVNEDCYSKYEERFIKNVEVKGDSSFYELILYLSSLERHNLHGLNEDRINV